jgi:hypothetical protein
MQGGIQFSQLFIFSYKRKPPYSVVVGEHPGWEKRFRKVFLELTYQGPENTGFHPSRKCLKEKHGMESVRLLSAAVLPQYVVRTGDLAYQKPGWTVVFLDHCPQLLRKGEGVGMMTGAGPFLKQERFVFRGPV